MTAEQQAAKVTAEQQAAKVTAEQQAAKVTAEKQAAAEKVVKMTTYVTMPGNTAIAVALVDAIDTDVQLTGAEFRARLSRPIVVDGHTLFADGAGGEGNTEQGRPIWSSQDPRRIEL